MEYDFSFIIPVYNRPAEINELLGSFLNVKDIQSCEIVIIEDGSEQTSEALIQDYSKTLNISYYKKSNSGPGKSRNYGMQKAKANYYIILDSDVLIPENYIINLNQNLANNYTDCYGGPDKAHHSFSDVQKAIDYSMTSFWTTGGIRGRKEAKRKFQPRSFNMGISKLAFEKSNGFSNIHPGEDPDLALRLNKLGFKTLLYENCFVYHKRRINWVLFYKQMRKFGLVRPILNLWHPNSHKLIYYFPTFFTFSLFTSIFLAFAGFYLLVLIFLLYFIFLFLDAWFSTKKMKIALYAIAAVFIQFFSYGISFFESTINIFILKRNTKKTYPNLFY